MWNFNSKLVRLKARERNQLAQRQLKFQFQTGAIKSLFRLRAGRDECGFQFQTGAIKRPYFTDMREAIELVFQFQTGAIKKQTECTWK